MLRKRFACAAAIAAACSLAAAFAIAPASPAFAQPSISLPSSLPAAIPNTRAISTLTISSGSVTLTQQRHLVETESGASSDDLTTADPPASVKTGDVFELSLADAAHAVTVKNGSGAKLIATPNGVDWPLTSLDQVVYLRWTGAQWRVLTAAGGGAGGVPSFSDLDAQPSVNGISTLVGEADKAGQWVVSTSDQSTLVAADPEHCVSRPFSGGDGAAGARIRAEWLNRPGYVLVTWCGAAGDGATDDTDALQAALDLGNDIVFPEGTYRITAALTKTGQKWTISGAGAERTIVQPDAGTFDVFTFDNSGSQVTHPQMHDLSIKYSGDRTAGAFIDFADRPVDGRFYNLHGDGFWDFFYASPPPARTYFHDILTRQTGRTNGTKADCTFKFEDDAADTSVTTDVHFTDVQLMGKDTTASWGVGHLCANAVDGMYIENSHFIGFDNDYYFYPDNTGDQDRLASIHTVNSYFDWSALSHINLSGEADAYDGIYFVNATFRASHSGVGAIQINADVSNLSFIGGVIEANDHTGIVTQAGKTVDGIVIEGVQFDDNNSDASAAAGDIRLLASGATIVGNEFQNGDAAGEAVRLLAGTTDAVVGGNNFGKSTAGALLNDEGTGTLIFCNAGLVSCAGGGLPSGGATGQVLAKNSGTDYDAHWVTSSGTVGSWADWPSSPTITFATPGDLSVTYGSRLARYQQIGNTTCIALDMTFTPTFTTASGSLRIADVPVALGASAAPPQFAVRKVSANPSVTIPGDYLTASVTTGPYLLFYASYMTNDTSDIISAANLVSGEALHLTTSGCYETD